MALPTPKRIKGLLELMDEALEMDAAKEAVLRLGLKADNTAADRAKAMDYTDELYRGSNSPETKVKLSTGHEHGITGISTTPFLEEAAFHGSSIIPLLNKKVDTEDFLTLVDDYKIKYGKEHTEKSLTNYAKKRNIGASVFDDPLGDLDIRYLNPADVRSKFAKFNPKYAGIPLLTGGAGGAFMSTNLLAAPSGQPEFREAPMSFLDKAKKYAADSYEYAANEGGPIGKFLYSGGAEALKDIEQGTTPMVKTGRLPAMPTGAALARLLELLQL